MVGHLAHPPDRPDHGRPPDRLTAARPRTIVLWNCEVPSGPVTDNVAVYVPGVVNVWFDVLPARGPAVAERPRPRRDRAVDWSVNDTVRGVIPINGVAVKKACGGAGVTTIALVVDDERRAR